MFKMGCLCGNTVRDEDGHIVYDIYSRKDLEKYNKDVNKLFENIITESPIFNKCYKYLWLCDKCKKAHVWIKIPKFF